MRSIAAIAIATFCLGSSNCSNPDNPFIAGEKFSVDSRGEEKLEDDSRDGGGKKKRQRDNKTNKKTEKSPDPDAKSETKSEDDLPQEVAAPVCPDGMIDEQGICFGVGAIDESCSNVCGFYNLPYNTQTANLIGSNGNKALCRKVANALGFAAAYAQQETALRDLAEIKESLYWGTEDSDLKESSSYFLRPLHCHINETLKSLYGNEPGVSSIRWRNTPSVDIDFYRPDRQDFVPIADPALTDENSSAPDARRICGCTKS